MTNVPSFRVPYWTAFAFVTVTLGVGFIGLSIWAGPPVWRVLGVVLGLWFLERFTHRTVYRVELVGPELRARSMLRTWCVSLAEVRAITPGWALPWWRANRNHYVLLHQGGPRLFVWCGKGLAEFLACVAAVEPRLAQADADGVSRTEHSRGRTGFGRLALPEQADR